MSYKVRIDSFEGPFDLLLYLVSRQKVDIGAISITQIADQYLAEVSRMDNLDLDVASDFLLVASTLLEIKAESLLPRERDAVAEEFEELAPSEARDILVERLLAYKQYKNAASALHMRFVSEGRMHPRPFGPDACFLNLMPDYLKDVTMDGLALLAARAFARDCAAGEKRSDALTEEMFSQYLYSNGLPDPELLIRPGGEKRISNYLLWQCAYSEFYFCDTLWPDFDEREFDKALIAYQHRERRFGGVKP